MSPKYVLLIMFLVMCMMFYWSKDSSKQVTYFLINDMKISSDVALNLTNQADALFLTPHLPKLANMLYRLLLSKQRSALISVGIPTVKRNKNSYLRETMFSLLSNLSVDEASRVLFVVFIAEVISNESVSSSEENQL